MMPTAIRLTAFIIELRYFSGSRFCVPPTGHLWYLPFLSSFEKITVKLNLANFSASDGLRKMHFWNRKNGGLLVPLSVPYLWGQLPPKGTSTTSPLIIRALCMQIWCFFLFLGFSGRTNYPPQNAENPLFDSLLLHTIMQSAGTVHDVKMRVGVCSLMSVRHFQPLKNRSWKLYHSIYQSNGFMNRRRFLALCHCHTGSDEEL